MAVAMLFAGRNMKIHEDLDSGHGWTSRKTREARNGWSSQV